MFAVHQPTPLDGTHANIKSFKGQKMFKKVLTMALIGTTTFALLAGSAQQVMATEEAKYTVSIQDGDFELREYEASIQAEVTVQGNREGAGSKAFQTLFQYISGANRSRQKIAMTSPVGQSEKIPMTAPVGQSPSSKDWVVSFMLPASLGPNTAPEPTDPRVSLHVLPARRVASVRYAGGDDEETYQQHLQALQNWMLLRTLKGTGELVWARYDPPGIPLEMRRNEILLTVK
jgi:hypothetical protein